MESQPIQTDLANSLYKKALEAYEAGDLYNGSLLVKRSLELYPTKEAILLEIKLSSTPFPTEAKDKLLKKKHQGNEELERLKQQENEELERLKQQRQQQQVDVLLQKTELYDILGIDKDADFDKIKYSYRKLAILFHPDKNKAQNSTEAFKKISHAYTILSDPEKRKKYDIDGNENSEYKFSNYFSNPENDISLEELTKMANEVINPKKTHYSNTFHIIPFIIILFVSFYYYVNEDEIFRLEQSETYKINHFTSKFTSYFVKESYSYDIERDPWAVNRIENKVESQYINMLTKQCSNEKSSRKTAINRAKTLNEETRSAEINAAYNMPLPSCELLSSKTK